jgi:hypothetical protein
MGYYSNGNGSGLSNDAYDSYREYRAVHANDARTSKAALYGAAYSQKHAPYVGRMAGGVTYRQESAWIVNMAACPAGHAPDDTVACSDCSVVEGPFTLGSNRGKAIRHDELLTFLNRQFP